MIDATLSVIVREHAVDESFWSTKSRIMSLGLMLKARETMVWRWFDTHQHKCSGAAVLARLWM